MFLAVQLASVWSRGVFPEHTGFFFWVFFLLLFCFVFAFCNRVSRGIQLPSRRAFVSGLCGMCSAHECYYVGVCCQLYAKDTWTLLTVLTTMAS